MSDKLLEVKNIHKSFSTVEVLHGISFEISKGEILGIIGENGAGKSTMMKILSGIYTPTSGEIYFENKKVIIKKPLDAKSMGISIIPQEFNLINDLTVYDNIFLGSELLKSHRILDKDEMKARTKKLLENLHINIAPEEKIENLSAAEKQMVEISKALAFKSKILIMDEPTSVLTQHEIDILFDLMRNLEKSGLTIIYISHKLKEVKEICNRVLILRDGNFVLESIIENVTPEEMAKGMVGRELSQVFPSKPESVNDLVFEIKNVTVPKVITNISFTLRKGEILGLGGLVGAGRTEVAETIIGLRMMSSDEIYVNGKKEQIQSPEDAVKLGIGYLSEDRQGRGIITSFSVTHNVSLVSLPKYSHNFLQWINEGNEDKASRKYEKLFNLKTPSLSTALEFLSGGNQQKVSLSKTIDTDPSILIVDEPTRGIDVSAKQEIYQFINSLAKSGVSCIFISSEIEELIGMCNRVVVMHEGQVTGILEGDSVNEEEIMLYATGLK